MVTCIILPSCAFLFSNPMTTFLIHTWQNKTSKKRVVVVLPIFLCLYAFLSQFQGTNGIIFNRKTNRLRAEHPHYCHLLFRHQHWPLRTTTTTTSATTSTRMSAETTTSSPSFYKRLLPETCVAFASQKGKKIFASAMANGGLKSFFPLIQQFTTQTEPAYCGLSTLVLVLNALAVDPQQHWRGPWRWYEESMLNCCLDLEDVKGKGITLRDFRCLAHCQGLSIELHYADQQSTLENFRSAVKQACCMAPADGVQQEEHGINQHIINNNSNSNSNEEEGEFVADRDEPLGDVLVISYSRKIMGQTGSGHFSPLAAYDPESDSVLILDTARFKYGAHWAKLPLVYEAMKPIDPDTGKSRGYALVSFSPPQPEPPTNTDTSSNAGSTILQPVSLLFRSKLTQNVARRQYREFLESKTTELTWAEACDYWLRGDTKLNNVWTILEPLRMPHREEEKAMVMALRRFVLDLLHNVEQGGPCSCCASTRSKTICMSEKEAIFVVYLGSLSRERRSEMVMNFESSNASTVTREQLLKEANLIATAVACCKESTF